ncbi:hypothetical protein [Arthrobacter sp. NA-172]|uniref:hypothetical protein n=1 Tax=Arthrobacter sp. NA-172 TaxID=3367524 RepID=UPI00375444DB
MNIHHGRTITTNREEPSTSAAIAKRLLTFPEPAELCLGYTTVGSNGSGSGAAFAQRMADGIAVAIAHGLSNPEHIEEIGILNEGIGSDRISDAVGNVLKAHFITYTQGICLRHGIEMQKHKVRNTRVFPNEGRWLTESVDLPTNPENNKPIILVPEMLLNDLPTLNADDWFDSDLNGDIRNQFNLSVGQSVRKSDIVQFARRHPERVRKWARSQTSRKDLQGYDFSDDPRGVVQWDKLPVVHAESNPLSLQSEPRNEAELRLLISQMLKQFQRFVEDQRGWSLLWDSDGKEKPEEPAQLVFLGMAQHYLRLFNVELDREVELGRGPVDFKIASGSKLRMLIEIKKAHNGKFWHGLQTQLPSYLQSDACNFGWYLAIRYRNNPTSEIRMKELPGLVKSTAQKVGKTIEYAAVDGRPKDSASKQE